VLLLSMEKLVFSVHATLEVLVDEDSNSDTVGLAIVDSLQAALPHRVKEVVEFSLRRI